MANDSTLIGLNYANDRPNRVAILPHNCFSIPTDLVWCIVICESEYQPDCSRSPKSRDVLVFYFITIAVKCAHEFPDNLACSQCTLVAIQLKLFNALDSLLFSGESLAAKVANWHFLLALMLFLWTSDGHYMVAKVG